MRTMAQVRQALSSLSGFPEWLPSGHIVEQHFVDILRRTFELHGFSGIQTRAVEPLSELTKKGETSKEVYLLSRLQADPAESEADPRKQLGLHFDLTVQALPDPEGLARGTAPGGTLPRVHPGRYRHRR